MKNLPSVLLIDDETDFQAAFAESLRAETQKDLFQLELASTGKQGLKIIHNNHQQGRKTFAFIDIILPDILGSELINEIEPQNTNLKGILISAHKSDAELEQIQSKYDWLIGSLSKPLDKNKLVQTIKRFFGSSRQLAFDYTALDRETADFLHQEAEKIKTLIKQTVRGIIETGERLSVVKQRLKHGEFMSWVESEINCHYSTALHFMRVWQTFGTQKDQISALGINPSVLYLLSAPSMPKQLRTEIVEMAKSGNLVSIAEAKRLKKEYIERQSDEGATKSTPEALTTIDVSAESSSASSAQPETSRLHSTEKPKIVGVIPQVQPATKFWHLGKHLLYCGSAQSPEFRARLPATVALNIGFPDAPSWSKEALFPLSAKSTLVFQSVFQDLDLVILRKIIARSIELCTESGEAILFSFLPYPEMLILADNLNCQCFIADSDWQKCQDILTFWSHLS